jgi:hypothetical protein
MTKVLILDVDVRNTGTSSIGSDERIEELYGYKPIHIKSMRGLNEFLKAAFEEYMPAGSYEKVWKLKAPYDKADIVVMDTISGLQKIMKPEIQGAAPSMTQAAWGQLGDKMSALLLRLATSDKSLIVMCHTKLDKDGASGQMFDMPKLQGSIKDDLADYFDFTMFSQVMIDKQGGKVKYLWQVIPNEMRRACRALRAYNEEAAKTGGLMEQDFAKLFELAKQNTSGAVRICVLGPAGSGKTYSLGTIPVEVKV